MILRSPFHSSRVHEVTSRVTALKFSKIVDHNNRLLFFICYDHSSVFGLCKILKVIFLVNVSVFVRFEIYGNFEVQQAGRQ